MLEQLNQLMSTIVDKIETASSTVNTLHCCPQRCCQLYCCCEGRCHQFYRWSQRWFCRPCRCEGRQLLWKWNSSRKWTLSWNRLLWSMKSSQRRYKSLKRKLKSQNFFHQCMILHKQMGLCSQCLLLWQLLFGVRRLSSSDASRQKLINLSSPDEWVQRKLPEGLSLAATKDQQKHCKNWLWTLRERQNWWT